MNHRTLIVGLTVLAAVAIGSRLPAQAIHTRQVAVALVDTLSSPEHRVEVLRFSDPARPDVILLPTGSATPGDLAAGIAAYRRSLARAPSRSGQVGRISVTRHSLEDPEAEPMRAGAHEMLTQVRRAPIARVGNYGRGRWRTFEVRVDG